VPHIRMNTTIRGENVRISQDLQAIFCLSTAFDQVTLSQDVSI